MKIKISITVILLCIGMVINGQNKKQTPLEGSWMGKTNTKDLSMSELVLFRIELKKNSIKGYMDFPDKRLKDISLDKMWRVKDSVFADARNSLGWPETAPLIFKGVIMPGDSVIDGVWGGNTPLKLSRTNYVFKLKTNTNPQVAGYKIIKLIESTPFKDQQATGDCWSFATTSFIETEAIRLGKKPVVLTPMFFVRPTYINKAENYIRRNGSSFFGEGDLTFSVMKAYKEFGAIPESVYSGKLDSDTKHDHADMNNALLEKVKFYKNSHGDLTPEIYRRDMDEILTKTLGKVPDTFVYDGKQFTTESFAKEMIGINPDDYVEITSFNHHPFYSKFNLEIEANWNNNQYLNLPLDDFSTVIDDALIHNYSVCWDGDIYEGFNDGFAILGDTKIITQQIRQAAFDNRTTEDIHNMHIIGIAENEKGNRFYIVKNSGDAKDCGGYLYMSKEYLLLKTISVMVNKNSIPKSIMKKVKKNI
ncbi:C1 family peptidase [Flavobacterium sp. LB2P84]|uniref:C1 family peptidase n=1 Tax=Flavobacterium yafengii TaxID=3041253 RepID=A0AAW6TPH7_9FLAO|nr:C1 family peptidase [Flavobacterium yafengii]MDI5950356.1 C1 family peptidase [Flavobacterium yafengii]MDI6033737.1 C1 family peptidase [Flavobacterium yafengii]